MNEEFKKILNKIDAKSTSVSHEYINNLVNKIVFKIDIRAKRETRLKTFSLILVSVMSIIIAVPIISQIITSFTQSGFYNYLSIIFSDGDVALVYWKEILFSLAESLPVITITGLLIVLAIFTWSALMTASIVRNELTTA